MAKVWWSAAMSGENGEVSKGVGGEGVCDDDLVVRYAMEFLKIKNKATIGEIVIAAAANLGVLPAERLEMRKDLLAALAKGDRVRVCFKPMGAADSDGEVAETDRCGVLDHVEWPQAPLYLAHARIPWEWLALPKVLLPAVLVATNALTYDCFLAMDDRALLGWTVSQIPPNSAETIQLAVASMDLASAHRPGTQGYTADSMVLKLKDYLILSGQSIDMLDGKDVIDTDIAVRLEMCLNSPERIWDAPTADGAFSDNDRRGKPWTEV